MDPTLANLEANYKFCVELFRKSPTTEGEKDLAKKQIIIDETRACLRLSTRWFTKQEIRDFEQDEDSIPNLPRTPLDIPEDDSETVWAEVTRWVKVDEYNYSLKLDVLIEKLQAMREELGGDVPVWLQSDSYSQGGATRVVEYKGGVMIQ